LISLCIILLSLVINLHYFIYQTFFEKLYKTDNMSSSVKILLLNMQYLIDALMGVMFLCLARHLISRVDDLLQLLVKFVDLKFRP